jgi:hypothetical protein
MQSEAKSAEPIRPKTRRAGWMLPAPAGWGGTGLLITDGPGVDFLVQNSSKEIEIGLAC